MMQNPLANLIARYGIEDRLQGIGLKRAALQCSLAAGVVLILLLVLDTVTQTVLIAALGASSFIAFAVPRSLASQPRCIIGGYLVGMLAGASMYALNNVLSLPLVFTAHAGMILCGALAMGIAMFVMLLTRTEHPPAAALALGLVLNEWTPVTLLFVIVGVIVISLCKQLVLPHLLDLL